MATFACLGIMRLDLCFQLRPGNHSLHRLQKLFPAAGPSVLLKTRPAGKCYLTHRDLHSITSLCNRAVEIRLIQRLPKDLPAPSMARPYTSEGESRPEAGHYWAPVGVTCSIRSLPRSAIYRFPPVSTANPAGRKGSCCSPHRWG